MGFVAVCKYRFFVYIYLRRCCMCERICIGLYIYSDMCFPFHSKQTLFEFTHSIYVMWLYRKFARHSLITHTYRAVIHNRNVHVNK